MTDISNPAFLELAALGIADATRMEFFHPHTRDKSIPVYRDAGTGLLVLERHELPDDYYASEKPPDRDATRQLSITELASGERLMTRTLDDQQRRFELFQDVIKGRSVCDFGAGFGGFVALAATVADRCVAVEPRPHCHEYAREALPDIRYVGDISGLDESFDVITLFHVLEHLPDALAKLKALRSHLNDGGRLVVEVPHARDFLIQSVDLPEFRDFTFWSEHLVLHTRDTLEALLGAAGYRDITVRYEQRYGFTNHLNWFVSRKPGGHESLRHMEDPLLEEQYRAARERDGTSDTLIAEAYV
jgi:2-polyprenyl-3-methyl-5-hydroxy-6-metoxy-1,4-benzoquinol methylase